MKDIATLLWNFDMDLLSNIDPDGILTLNLVTNEGVGPGGCRWFWYSTMTGIIGGDGTFFYVSISSMSRFWPFSILCVSSLYKWQPKNDIAIIQVAGRNVEVNDIGSLYCA